jgi:hypothetical protein
MIQNVLAKEEWMGRMAEEDFRALTPLIHSHVDPYGSFELDMAKRCLLTVRLPWRSNSTFPKTALFGRVRLPIVPHKDLQPVPEVF